MKAIKSVPPEGRSVYYRSDGTGRDSYIRDHNGGLLSHDRIHQLKHQKRIPEKKLSMGKTTYKTINSVYTPTSNRFAHYISDGSGRDSYVKTCEGGNSQPFRWRNETDFFFKNTLRSPAKSPNVQRCQILEKP